MVVVVGNLPSHPLQKNIVELATEYDKFSIKKVLIW